MTDIHKTIHGRKTETQRDKLSNTGRQYENTDQRQTAETQRNKLSNTERKYNTRTQTTVYLNIYIQFPFLVTNEFFIRLC